MTMSLSSPTRDGVTNGSPDGSSSILLTVADETVVSAGSKLRSHTEAATRQRRLVPGAVLPQTREPINVRESVSAPGRLESGLGQAINWRRMLLLIIAITIHNIPGEVMRA